MIQRVYFTTILNKWGLMIITNKLPYKRFDLPQY